MLEDASTKFIALILRVKRISFSLSLLFLLIEFFDELTYAIDGAALPAMRAELQLTYAQVGLMLGLPGVLGTFIFDGFTHGARS